MPNSDDFRVKRIQQLLLEMARGNFFFSLDPTDKNDNVASLIVMLNMVNEEIRASFIHQGFTNAQNTPQCMVQMSFLLNGNGIVEMANKKACSLLSLLPKDIIGRPLSDFLSDGSRLQWDKKLHKLRKKKRSETVQFLEFRTREGLSLGKDCNITMFRDLEDGGHKILVDTVLFSKGEPFDQGLMKNTLRVTKGIGDPKVRLGQEDIQMIRDVHDLIINNLENELPGLKELAHQMGTNEYKLKYGFKQLYGTTVFRFLIQERLRKAKTLIQHSNLSLKRIAHMTGFKSTTHFSRAFKEKYGLSPSALRK